MFTGLVEGLGKVVGVRGTSREMELSVDLGQLAGDDGIGASIALSGVCCTVTRVEGARLDFTLTEETLRRTWMGSLAEGDILNIERPMRPTDFLGGHLVQGHVDGVGEVVAAVDGRQGGEWWVRLPQDLMHYCVVKGSIALDGVSLTIAALDGDRVMAAIIPHTAQVTTIGGRPAGAPVNVEVDILAKYVDRMLEARFGPGGAAQVRG